MRRKILIASFLIFLALPVLAAVLYEHFTYYLFTGESVTVGWDAVSNAQGYEFEAINVERGNRVFAQGQTSELQATVVIPKTGHWIFQVRATNASGVSDWARSDSNTHATVNGQPQSWWVFAWIAPATGLELQ